MVTNNFKCGDCDNEWHEVHYNMSYTANGLVYRNRLGNNIFCPHCKSNNVEFIERERENFNNVQMGKYSSASPADKKRMITKRHQEHAKKNKDYAQHKYEQIRNKTLNT